MMRIFVKALLLFSLFQGLKAEVDGLGDGPVSAVMENLALSTAEITDEIFRNLEVKFNVSADALLGSIEVITATAMTQLGDALFEAYTKLATCPQLWTMPVLLARIDEQLTNCTLNLMEQRTVFQNESVNFIQNFQAYVADLSDLTAACNVFNLANVASPSSFASSTLCFAQKLAELNQNISQLISQANNSMLRTRQLTHAGVAKATDCASDVVKKVIKELDTDFEKCLEN